jgi:class 3 adenylate cyclase
MTALEAGYNQDLRRLRFRDPALERAFRADYSERARDHVRKVVGLAALVPLVINGLAEVIDELDRLAARDFWETYAVIIILLLAILRLARSRSFERVEQPSLSLLCLILGGFVILHVAPRLPGAEGPMVALAIVTYALVKLRFLAALLTYWTLMGFFLYRAIWVVQTPAPLIFAGLASVTIANFFGMLAAYMMEQSARRDFLLRHLLEQERRKSDRLLLNILPATIADRLKESAVLEEARIADLHPEVTILFADLVDFTPLAAKLPPGEVVAMLNLVFSRFDRLAAARGLEKIKTIGDAYMAVAGLPEPRPDHAEAAASLALAMQDEMTRLPPVAGRTLQLRIGLHTGPVVAGVIGTQKFIYDLWGDTVNLASRMEAHGLPGAVHVTRAIRDRLEGQYAFRERGPVEVKGVGPVDAFLLLGPASNRGDAVEEP